jgi:hypothetical protein
VKIAILIFENVKKKTTPEGVVVMVEGFSAD